MAKLTCEFLLVDAAEEWRGRLARLLEMGGHQVSSTELIDLDNAVAEVAAGDVGCLLLDPHGQDRTSVEELLDTARTARCRVVLLGSDAAEAASLGVDEFIAKPYPKPRAMLDQLGLAAVPSATGAPDSPESHMLRERCKDLEARLSDQEGRLEEAQETFNQELSRMMNIVSNMMDGILFLDAEGNITLMNPVAEEMLDLRAFMVVGHNLFDVEADGELLRAVRKACESSPDWRESCSTIEVHDDGQDLRYVKARIGRVVDFRGEAAGTLIQLEDVTSDYKTDQLKNQYLSIVAHELRTPLTGIKTFSTMLSKGSLGELSDRQGQVVESIREQSLRLEHQIDKLVNLGHLDSEDVGQDQEPIDIGELVGQAVVPFETVAREKELELVQRLPEPGIAIVLCDRAAVRRAVQALVENAVKFSASGGRVEVEASAAGDGSWQVAVRDRGCGIDVRYHRRIFEKFFQVEDPLTRHHGGSGLGLFFVKSIVEAHRSEVKVESELGQGASFSFQLPSSVTVDADVDSEIPTTADAPSQAD